MSVGSKGVVYAAIHEYGGIIRARRAPYLVFRTYDGRWHRVKKVRMPARPYARPALKKEQAKASEFVARAITADYKRGTAGG